MNITQQGIVTLLKSAVTGLKYELPKGFALELDETKELIKKHHLIQLIYVGTVNCGIPSDTPLMKSLFSAYCKQLVRSERQMKEVKKVFQAFDENGIDYIPTKGCNMKALYPKPEMRVMGDADIFIRKSQCPLIGQVMKKIGFTQNLENYNNDVWDSDHLHLELHKHMCSYYNEQYYDDVWDRVTCAEGKRYVFSTEDAFIHIFNHFARHYRLGGIGCRHVMDLYVYRRAYPQMDESYICQEMKKLHLQDFYKNICMLLEVWFEEGTSNEAVDAIGQYIWSSGSWGTLGTYAVARQVERANDKGKISHSRLHAVITSLFPPMTHMVRLYPMLEKVPCFLPVMWIVRGLRVVLFRRKNMERHLRQWNAIDDEKVNQYQRHYKLVGLDVKESLEV